MRVCTGLFLLGALVAVRADPDDDEDYGCVTGCANCTGDTVGHCTTIMYDDTTWNDLISTNGGAEEGCTECDAGYFDSNGYDNAGGQCIQKNANCEDYDMATGDCNGTCAHGTYFCDSGACTNAGGYVRDDCAACDVSCDGCDGPDDTDCEDGADDVDVSGAADASPCADGYYDNSGTSCTQCNVACDGCTAAGTDNCNSCADGYGSDGSDCVACAASCDTCDDIGAGDCTGCDSDEYLDGPAPAPCAACSPECDGCTDTGADNCISCADGYGLDGGSCVACDGGCDTCANGGASTDCTACKTGYYDADSTGGFDCQACVDTTSCVAEEEEAVCGYTHNYECEPYPFDGCDGLDRDGNCDSCVPGAGFVDDDSNGEDECACDTAAGYFDVDTTSVGYAMDCRRGFNETDLSFTTYKQHGQSGKITVYPCHQDWRGCEELGVRVSMSALRELDEYGNIIGKSGPNIDKHSVNQLASRDFTWDLDLDHETSGDFEGSYANRDDGTDAIQARRFSFSTDLFDDTTFTTEGVIFSEEGKFCLGDDTPKCDGDSSGSCTNPLDDWDNFDTACGSGVCKCQDEQWHVEAGDFKFTINVENWPFLDDSDSSGEVGEYLQFEFDIEQDVYLPDLAASFSNADAGQNGFKLGRGDWKMSDFYHDGTEWLKFNDTTIAGWHVSVKDDACDGQAKATVTVNIPMGAPGSTLKYDPSLSFVFPESTLPQEPRSPPPPADADGQEPSAGGQEPPADAKDGVESETRDGGDTRAAGTSSGLSTAETVGIIVPVVVLVAVAAMFAVFKLRHGGEKENNDVEQPAPAQKKTEELIHI